MNNYDSDAFVFCALVVVCCVVGAALIIVGTALYAIFV